MAFGYTTLPLEWDAFDAEVARLNAELAEKRAIKDTKKGKEWIEACRAMFRVEDKIRYLIREQGPRPSLIIEPLTLYRIIQGKRGWGYWFEIDGIRVRSHLFKQGIGDRAGFEMHLPGDITDDGREKVIGGWQEDHGQRRMWWVNEPTITEKARLVCDWQPLLQMAYQRA